MIIGIYGNIGTGKSTICKYLVDQYQFDYLELDQVAKKIESTNLDLIADLKDLKLQGIDVLSINEKEIDYQKMKDAIFDNFELNYKVSKIIWKYVKLEVEEYINKTKPKNLVIEAAVLPVLKLSEINYYFYLEANQSYNQSNKNLTTINKIQTEYNQSEPRNFILSNNKSIDDLFHQVDLIMVQLIN